MVITKVTGKNQGDIMVYALSTCPWCRKVKQLLNDSGVEYSFVDVDLAQGKEREELLSQVKKWNPALSFPVTVLNGTKAIIGFKETEIKEALKPA